MNVLEMMTFWARLNWINAQDTRISHGSTKLQLKDSNNPILYIG